MITTTILAIVESFLATLAYAVLFNVPKQYYTACGITGMAGSHIPMVLQPFPLSLCSPVTNLEYISWN